MLVKAGFSPGDPNDFLCGKPMQNSMYYDWKTWAKTHGVDGRSPAFTSVARSLKWIHIKQIFTAHMPVIQEIDELTGLSLFMLAAAGPTSDIESVYHLLKEHPAVIKEMNHE